MRCLIFSVVFILVCYTSFSQRESMSPDSKSIIRLIDATVRYAIENKANYSDQAQMTAIATGRASALGYTIDPSFQRYDFSGYTDQFKQSIKILNQFDSYETKDEYIAVLNEKIAEADRSGLALNEKNTVLFNLSLMIGILNYGEEIYYSNPFSSLYSPFSNYLTSFRMIGAGLNSVFSMAGSLVRVTGYLSWWKRWGRCLAAIVGGAIGGGLAGGIGGAALGTATLPIVGTVSLGAVGTVAGTVSGALSGAVNHCFRPGFFPRPFLI